MHCILQWGLKKNLALTEKISYLYRIGNFTNSLIKYLNLEMGCTNQLSLFLKY